MDRNGTLQMVQINSMGFPRKPVLALAFVSALLLTSAQNGSAQVGRKHVDLPDIPGYLTLKADFHMHTIFSDGAVLPSLRVREAWREGLDVIAITDHDSFRPDHVVGDGNTPFQMAQGLAQRADIILIRATEITRGVGHFNALFLDDANAVKDKDYFEAIKKAVSQGAFVHLNHPPPDAWGEEVQRLESENLLHGVEVYNGGRRRYFEHAHRWAVEKGLTVIGNSDLHPPSEYSYGIDPTGHRAMTLVFATERSSEAVREALFAGRTAVYSEDMLYGSEEYLRPLFDGSIKVLTPEASVGSAGEVQIQVLNDSDVDFQLVPADSTGASPRSWSHGGAVVGATNAVFLPAHRIVNIRDPLLAATIFDFQLPEDIVGAVEWSFDELQPDWKATVPRPFPAEIRPATVTSTDDALRITLGPSNAQPNGRWLVGGAHVDVPEWDHRDWAYVVIRARTSGPGEMTLGFNVNPDAAWKGPSPDPSPYEMEGVAAPLVGGSTVQTYLLPLEPRRLWGEPIEQLGFWAWADGPLEVEILSITVVPMDAFHAEDPAGVRQTAQGRLRYRVSNLLVAPETGLEVEIPVTVRFVPGG